jgi:glycosyltransferase involved in cell wall biosynthesis
VSSVQLNPYVRLLAGGLQTAGASVRLVSGISLPSLLVHRWRGLNVIHLHWLELLYASPRPVVSAWRLGMILLTLATARLWGIKVIYTVHNLAHHEGRTPRLNDWGNRALFRLASALHAHDAVTAGALAPWASKVYIVPHGSYLGAYPNTTDRAAARARLELTDAGVVYLFLGGVRPYKGLERLLDAFRGLDDPQARLLVAGHAHRPDYAAAIAALADRDPRVRLILRHVPDDELQFFFHASDACLLPYRAVTTSGAALLALSFGCPIVAPRLGPFPELAAGGRGILFEPDSADDLARALRQVHQLDQPAARAACLAYAQALAWPRLAQAHLAAYQAHR